jgi:rubrerythrin
MYRIVTAADRTYDAKAKNSIASLIAENNQDEQEAIKNYEVLLSCLNDVGASREQIATIEEIISDEKNHSMRLNQLLLDFDEVEPNKD